MESLSNQYSIDTAREALPRVERVARILDDEWWRTVTALCLHADLRHVIANAVTGAYFMGMVGRSLGNGFGLLLVLLGGAAGNFMNAAFQGAPHNSVGTSTAIFAAIGVLVGTAVAHRRRSGMPGRRVWLPVAAGLGLLAMMGTGEGRVDNWAHLGGLAAGVAFAWLVPATPSRSGGWRLAALLGAALAAAAIVFAGLYGEDSLEVYRALRG